ncbi:MAG: hypothetical protein J0H68_08255 [Sphingobacteriia bacterium]|nr:hypothetical protein [Sphingobacteriia bacterium]
MNDFLNKYFNSKNLQKVKTINPEISDKFQELTLKKQNDLMDQLEKTGVEASKFKNVSSYTDKIELESELAKSAMKGKSKADGWEAWVAWNKSF